MQRRVTQRLRNAVRDVLLNDWEPIGVGDSTEAANEYDSYIETICRLLVSGADCRRPSVTIGKRVNGLVSSVKQPFGSCGSPALTCDSMMDSDIEGYLVIFDVKNQSFGLAVKGGQDGCATFIGCYGGFVETVNAM